jgi:hypothetical protein
MSAPDPRCPRCAEPLPPTAAPPDPAARCPRCGAEPSPAEELLILDDPAEPLPDAAFDDVPVVRPAARAARPPEARPLPRQAAPKPVRAPARDEAERPRPRVGLAVAVMLLLAVATCGGLSVIAYALWAGFKRVAPRRAEAPLRVEMPDEVSRVRAWRAGR